MMQRVAKFLVASFGCAFLWAGLANAQFGREGTWMTIGGNAQRSAWVRTDGKITDTSVPSGFQLLWKIKLDQKESSALTQPLIMDRYIGYQGFRSFALMGGADAIYAVDTDLDRLEWKKPISSQQGANSSCSSANIASVALPTTAEFPNGLSNFSFFGRGGAAKSGVGEPYQGAVTLAVTPVVRPFPRGARAFFQRTREPIVLHALSSDGMFHTMWLGNGFEPAPPLRFVPPNADARGLIVLDKVAYAVTEPGCGAPGGVWALDLTTKKVTSWTGEAAKIIGSEGAAIGPDGTLYVATAAGDSTYSSSVIALDPKTLKPKDWYTAAGAEFTSTPVIFQYRNKVLAAAVSKDGRVHLLSTASLGGADHKTPVFATSASSNGESLVAGALATWQDADFTVWLLASTPVPVDGFADAGGKVTNGAVVAWKIVDQNGGPAVEPGWISRNMISPAPPSVINGVVFALSTGHAAPASGSSPAVLYALDGANGKELWNSGKSISSPVEAAGVSGGGGQVYVTTQDGVLYAFGFPMEH